MIWKIRPAKFRQNFVKIQQNSATFCKIWVRFSNFWRKFDKNVKIRERCEGVNCVDLGERFPTNIWLQRLASIQRRMSLPKFMTPVLSEILLHLFKARQGLAHAEEVQQPRAARRLGHDRNLRRHFHNKKYDPIRIRSSPAVTAPRDLFHDWR